MTPSAALFSLFYASLERLATPGGCESGHNEQRASARNTKSPTLVWALCVTSTWCRTRD